MSGRIGSAQSGTDLASKQYFRPSLDCKQTQAGFEITTAGPSDALERTAVSYQSQVLISTKRKQIDNNENKFRIILDQSENGTGPEDFQLLSAVWQSLFPYVASGSTASSAIDVELKISPAPLIEALSLLGAKQNDSTYSVTRSSLFQLFGLGSTPSCLPAYPYVPAFTGNVSHPLRPRKPTQSSRVYSRLVPHLGSYFNLHVADEADLNTIHEWLNDPRVDLFWQEKGSLQQHKKFLTDRTEDPHVLSVIGSYVPLKWSSTGCQLGTSEPATYSEIYWVTEDRLGPLMKDVRDYDRGLHMLVGSDAHRGPHRVRAWMPSLVHYCFISEPRTQRVVCEPNAKNDKIIKYLESVGFERHGDVEFPHKTAALMIVDRKKFYERCPF